jgi:hypothetical protein
VQRGEREVRRVTLSTENIIFKQQSAQRKSLEFGFLVLIFFTGEYVMPWFITSEELQLLPSLRSKKM